MKLTAKQEAFATAYCTNGGNASEAYRSAYDAKKMKPESVSVKASELLKNGKVAVRVEEIQSKAKNIAEKKLNITVSKKQEWLKEVIERSLKHEQARDNEGNPMGDFKFNASAVISAINELNKMDGDHAASKVDMTAIVSLADFADSLPEWH